MAIYLSEVIRNAMLEAIDDPMLSSTTDYEAELLKGIELVNTESLDLGRYGIDWHDAIDGEKKQDGTITITVEVPSELQDQENILGITGFKFTSGEDGAVVNGQGTFEETVYLDGGFDYTVIVGEITISIPE